MQNPLLSLFINVYALKTTQNCEQAIHCLFADLVQICAPSCCDWGEFGILSFVFKCWTSMNISITYASLPQQENNCVIETYLKFSFPRAQISSWPQRLTTLNPHQHHTRARTCGQGHPCVIDEWDTASVMCISGPLLPGYHAGVPWGLF